MTQIRTPRLTLRDWQVGGLTGAERTTLETRLTQMLTPPVLAHLPPSLSQTDPISEWIAHRDAASRVMVLEANEDMPKLIGLMFAHAPQDTPEVWHIGYLLAEAAWGRGYATEALKALVELARAEGIAQLMAGVERGNPASAAVLRKAGFVQDQDSSDEDMMHFERLLGI